MDTTAFPGIDHFDYDDIVDCQCHLCKALAAAEANMKYVADCRYHSPKCICVACQDKAVIEVAYHKAMAQRDLYCELAFLASREPNGPRMLRWVHKLMLNENYPPQQSNRDAWWAEQAPLRTLGDWISEWQVATMPKWMWAVSGMIC